MCLHSAPRAGSWILLNVTGHLRLTLTPVCCTLSSELLANHLFTGEEGGGGRGKDNIRCIVHLHAELCCYCIVTVLMAAQINDFLIAVRNVNILYSQVLAAYVCLNTPDQLCQ